MAGRVRRFVGAPSLPQERSGSNGSSFILNVTFDCEDPRRLSTFWSAVTGYRPVIERDDFVALQAPDKRGVRGILFFRVPEPKVVKNRMHVDLASKDPEAEITRLESLGATRVEHRQGNGTSWTVMLDPEGNEFCLG
ncbi:MAG TPA: VOC family protein [Acidimicrobiales bacterium]|nr:VOC family protein [Acidimicrobiales bacterium]